MRYRTNTDHGSSGAPCLAMDWSLVALHHLGDPAQGPPVFNQGVPIGLIRDSIKAAVTAISDAASAIRLPTHGT